MSSLQYREKNTYTHKKKRTGTTWYTVKNDPRDVLRTRRDGEGLNSKRESERKKGDGVRRSIIFVCFLSVRGSISLLSFLF